ncbi:unnamed protein product [Arabidopsis halleri]
MTRKFQAQQTGIRRFFHHWLIRFCVDTPADLSLPLSLSFPLILFLFAFSNLKFSLAIDFCFIFYLISKSFFC